ncbi:MAG: leucyl/phenylalanyl-tRNA--protein transferase [Desulfobacteraceae bacterium]|nr:leucyl/phenylalanyl-tRNA--protein transferase [Desulfobacteraceae bacterium]MCF8094142.1 leucyl/phenylalanyl-tRNA--protein transferase [Desulfobacteraceae bacterium]
MPIFRLSDKVSFPPPHFAAGNGLLAIGGDLSESRLLLAYRNGIFPWFSHYDPILWWCPDPRLVLYPNEVHVPARLRRRIKSGVFEVTSDTAFNRVITECARVRTENNEETWLVDEMIEAYQNLHEHGYAHSVETWCRGELAGGLYGVCLGGVFFGESMFTRLTDASKVALVALCGYMAENDFDLIDCQVATGHLIWMGAREVSREIFLSQVAASVEKPTRKGKWKLGTKPLIPVLSCRN